MKANGNGKAYMYMYIYRYMYFQSLNMYVMMWCMYINKVHNYFFQVINGNDDISHDKMIYTNHSSKIMSSLLQPLQSSENKWTNNNNNNNLTQNYFYHYLIIIIMIINWGTLYVGMGEIEACMATNKINSN